MDERTSCIEYAKLSEQAERYDQMADYMKKVACMPNSLSNEERNLFSVAYKNVVGARRASWRILSSMEQRAGEKNDSDSEHKRELNSQYRLSVQKELNDICDDVISLLDNHLITKEDQSEEKESKIFYKKMKGDYYRYKVEVAPEDSQNLSEKSRQAYEEAYEEAKSTMINAHPIRLGLALNFSVYYYEIARDAQKACNLAKEAFDLALADLRYDDDDKETTKDSTLILQLLRDNLTLWTSELGEQEDEQEGNKD